jgi:hypothetical protein
VIPLSLILPPLYKEQREFVYAPQKYLTYICARRGGKSFAIRMRIIKRCLEEKNKTHVYVAPTFSPNVEMMYEAIAFNEGLKPYIYRAKRFPVPTIEFTSGSILYLKSFERPDNLRGLGISGDCYMDECNEIENEAEFWSAVRPIISAPHYGSLVLCGQFRGQNWYYDKLWKPGQTPNDKYKSWVVTPEKIPWYKTAKGKDDLLDAQTQLTKRGFQVEYLCYVLANSSAAHDPDDIQNCVKKVITRPLPKILVAGFDVGGKVDPAALTILDVANSQVVYSFAWKTGTKHEQQAMELFKTLQRFNCRSVIIDVTGNATGGHGPPDAVLKYYREALNGIHTYELSINESLKRTLVENFDLALQQNLISIPKENTELITQMMELEYHYRHSRYFYNAPRNHHDDVYFSCVYAWYGKLKRFYSNPNSGNVGPLFG